jgi:hypothetical protein
MGKTKSSSIELIIDDVRTDDPLTLVNSFSNFFLSKVQGLSTSPVNEINLFPPLSPITISETELAITMKSMSNEKSFGVDGIPQNVFIDSLCVMKNTVLDAMNSFAKHGLPNTLKVERVIPLHKKGSKLDVENYRPISNLSIFSKIYKKSLLSRLNDELPGAEGDHQHGFRTGHSTETALLTLQSLIEDCLDSEKQGVIYSIDLSAAFDLLKPDKFQDLFTNKISEDLMFAIMDFLTNRRFVVDYNGVTSPEKSLDRAVFKDPYLVQNSLHYWVTKIPKYRGSLIGFIHR